MLSPGFPCPLACGAAGECYFRKKLNLVGRLNSLFPNWYDFYQQVKWKGSEMGRDHWFLIARPTSW
jgi:hypothetical protein